MSDQPCPICTTAVPTESVCSSCLERFSRACGGASRAYLVSLTQAGGSRLVRAAARRADCWRRRDLLSAMADAAPSDPSVFTLRRLLGAV